MALRGICGNCAEAGSCAKVIPPAARIACKPRVPSEPRPGEQHAHRLPPPRAGERGEKAINHMPLAANLGLSAELEGILRQGERDTGRAGIDAIRFHAHPLLYLSDGQEGRPSEQVRQEAVVVWVQVLHKDVRQASLLRQMSEQGFDRFQPSGRGPDAYHRTSAWDGLECVFLHAFHGFHRFVPFRFPRFVRGNIHSFACGRHPARDNPERAPLSAVLGNQHARPGPGKASCQAPALPCSRSSPGTRAVPAEARPHAAVSTCPHCCPSDTKIAPQVWVYPHIVPPSSGLPFHLAPIPH